MSTSTNAEGRKQLILFVEDEAIIALAESMQLKAAGYEVRKAGTGEEAIAVFAREPASFDLVLMDLDLGPGMDGAEAAIAILAIRPLPLLFLSSHTEPEVVEKTERISSYGYVVKSAGPTVLMASIRMAFRIHEARALAARREEEMRRRDEAAIAALEARRRDLEERRKELRCLYAISAAATSVEADLLSILETAAASLPPAFAHDGAEASVELGAIRASRGWLEAPGMPEIAAPIIKGTKVAGLVRVAYPRRTAIPEELFPLEERQLLDAVARDIARAAERLEAQAALDREARIESMLGDLARHALAENPPLEDMAQRILDGCRKLTGAEHGYVSVIDPTSGENVGLTLSAMLGESCLISGEDRRVAFPRGADGRYGGLWGRALDTGKAHIENAPHQAPDARGLPQGHVPLGCLLSVPAMAGGRPVGQIALAAKPDGFTEEDLSLVLRVADFWALAIKASRDRDSLALLERVMNASENLLAVVDRDLRYRLVNAAFCAYQGLPSDSIMGKTVQEILEPETFARFEPYMTAALSGEVRVFEGDRTYPKIGTRRFLCRYEPWYGPEAATPALTGMSGQGEGSYPAAANEGRIPEGFIATIIDVSQRRG